MSIPRLVGALLVTFPLALNVPFTLLATRFDYPDVLRRPPGEVLTAFAAGGTGLVAIWYAFAALVVPFLVAIVLLPRATARRNDPRLALATAFGVVTATVQFVGLLRWTFVVPRLARAWGAATDDATRGALAVAFDVQHQLFGVLLGEHVGQLTMAAWTALVAWSLGGPGGRRWIALLGGLSSVLLVVGLVDGFATVLPFSPGPLASVPPVAFLLWSSWCVATGVLVWRGVGATPPATAEAST